MIAAFTATEWTLIIATVTTSILQIIIALRTGNKTQETHNLVNSRMSEALEAQRKFQVDQKAESERLLQTAIEKAFAEGVKQAVDIQKAVQPLAAQPQAPASVQAVKVVDVSEPIPVVIKKP